MDKWHVSWGLHRNTYTSRDSEFQSFDSEQEARNYWAGIEAGFGKGAWRDYVCWFATLIAPDGKKTALNKGNAI